MQHALRECNAEPHTLIINNLRVFSIYFQRNIKLNFSEDGAKPEYATEARKNKGCTE
jgi:hypothetical protein